MQSLETLRAENTELARVIAEEKDLGATVAFVEVCRALAGDSSNYTEETGDASEWTRWACLMVFDADEVRLLNLEGVDGAQYLDASGETVCYTVDDCGFRNVFDEETFRSIESEYAKTFEPDAESDLIQDEDGGWHFAGQSYDNALEALAGIMKDRVPVYPSRIFTMSDHGNALEIEFDSFAQDVAEAFVADPGTNYSDDGMAVYAADVWCPSCAKDIALRLLREKGWQAFGEDSDRFPQFALAHQNETDSPAHCASGRACLEAEELEDGSKVGKLLGEPLTETGDDYVRGYVGGCAELRPPLAKLYAERFSYLFDA